MTSIFTREGDAFVPAPEARASWYADALHGGPVAALFARAVEEVESPLEMMVTRLTVDLMRPVPARPLRVTTRVERAGKRIQVVSARLADEDTEVALASALRLRIADVPIPQHPRREVPAAPEGLAPAELRPVGGPWFHTSGIEMRIASGDFYEPGPATAWIRLTRPLFEDGAPTPLQRVAAAADFGNGVSRVLDSSFVFINADLSIHLSRYPRGEWVCLRSRTDLDGNGAGLAQSELFDTEGAIGHSLQMLYVDRAATLGG